MTDKFAQTWTPLVGPTAASILWRVAIIGILDSAIIVAAIAVALVTHNSPLFLGGICAALLVTVVFFRQLRAYAKACTAHFGVKVSIQNLPPMYPDRFESWRKRLQIGADPPNASES
jgi:hypothetical protein